MSLKKTLILSVLLHLCFFATAILLPAGLLQESSKIPDKEVFFVKLIEEVNKSDPPPPPFNKKMMEGFQTKDISAEVYPTENDISFYIYRTPASNVLSGGDKISKGEVADVSSGSGTNIEPTENIGISGINKGGATLPAGIIEIIKNSIERAKTYPFLARRRGIEGTVYISFWIGPQGDPEDIKILKSSGSSILDSATLDIVKKAAPFPHIDSLIMVPVVYRLRN